MHSEAERRKCLLSRLGLGTARLIVVASSVLCLRAQKNVFSIKCLGRHARALAMVRCVRACAGVKPSVQEAGACAARNRAQKMCPTTRNHGTLMLVQRAFACAGVNLSVQEAVHVHSTAVRRTCFVIVIFQWSTCVWSACSGCTETTKLVHPLLLLHS